MKPLPSGEQKSLTTARLTLGPVTRSDTEDIVRLDAIPAVMQYVAGQPRSRAEAIANMETRYLGLSGGTPLGAWLARRVADGTLVGLGLLGPLDDRDDIEVGYRLFPDHWGKGYATEIATALIAYGFDQVGLHEIVGVTDPGNHASERVLEKCRLVRSGRIAAYGRDDLRFFRLSRQAWRSHSAAAGR